jgi:hypothetical protein
MAKAQGSIEKQLSTIAAFAEEEAQVFLSPEANFRRQKDETNEGYVTVLGDKSTFRIVNTDMAEANPTYSINPIRREPEVGRKKGEYRAYLAGESDNRAAWRTLIGRDVAEQDQADTDSFLIASGAQGNFSYDNRPKGPGNFVIGVSKTETNVVVDMLNKVIEVGGNAGLILLSRDKIQTEENPEILTLKLEEIPTDDFGLVDALLLKQTLNLMTNAAMILAGNVHGCRMVAMRASNQKLIDRSMRMVMDIWKEDTGKDIPITVEELYYYVLRVEELKKEFSEQNIYTPSIVKMLLAMLYLGKKPTPQEFLEVLDFLREKQERLDFLNT